MWASFQKANLLSQQWQNGNTAVTEKLLNLNCNILKTTRPRKYILGLSQHFGKQANNRMPFQKGANHYISR